MLALCLALLLFASGCGAERSTVIHGVKAAAGLTMDTKAGTIQDLNQNVYQYTIRNTTITVTYPDGESKSYDSRAIQGALFVNQSDSQYPTPYAFVSLMEQSKSDDQDAGLEAKGKSIAVAFVGIILLVVGAFNYKWPEKTFNIEKGWKYKYLEPSDHAMELRQYFGKTTALIGGILLIASIILMLSGILQS